MALQSLALPVLVTRPHPQAMQFAAQLRSAFGDTVAPLISPLLAPRFLWPTLPNGSFGALILTSQTGVTAAAGLRERHKSLPNRAFCVGDQTAALAREMGFDATSAAGDAQDLLQMLVRAGHEGPFLHLHGQDVTGDLKAALAAKGVMAQGCAVYAQVEQPLGKKALALINGPLRFCAPLFSPRSARLFVAALGVTTCRAPLQVVAMSLAVADAIPAGIAASIVIADHPDAASMVAAVGACRFKP